MIWNEHQEPKGLDCDEIGVTDDYRAVRRVDAVRGSTLLKEAILRAKGLLPPKADPVPLPVPIRIPVRVTYRPTSIPTSCPHCGAPAKTPSPLIAHIQHTVASYYGIETNAMTSAQRGYEIAHPRQMAMYLSSILTPKSLPEIGRRFNRDHTTVIHAIKKVRGRIAADAEVALDAEVLRERLAV